MRTSHLSGKSLARGANREAHDTLGDSLVPRKASVKMETRRTGFDVNAARIVAINSCSDLPM